MNKENKLRGKKEREKKREKAKKKKWLITR